MPPKIGYLLPTRERIVECRPALQSCELPTRAHPCFHAFCDLHALAGRDRAARKGRQNDG